MRFVGRRLKLCVVWHTKPSVNWQNECNLHVENYSWSDVKRFQRGPSEHGWFVAVVFLFFHSIARWNKVSIVQWTLMATIIWNFCAIRSIIHEKLIANAAECFNIREHYVHCIAVSTQFTYITSEHARHVQHTQSVERFAQWAVGISFCTKYWYTAYCMWVLFSSHFLFGLIFVDFLNHFWIHWYIRTFDSILFTIIYTGVSKLYANTAPNYTTMPN